MKRICILLCVVMLCGLLPGCAGEIPPVSTTGTTVATGNAATEFPEMPQEEDAFFFCNALESYRLYCQTPEGDAPRLMLDEGCSHVQKQGDTVYFLLNEDLYGLNLSTSQKQLIQEAVQLYVVTENCLLYSQFYGCGANRAPSIRNDAIGAEVLTAILYL